MFVSDLLHPNATLQDKLQSLYRLSGGKKIDLSFRTPYLELLEKFDNPHLSLPPVIHVAGTNGKGSTIAFMRSILEAAGRRVHVYTSPHLVRFNERIVLAGAEIDNANLEGLIDEANAHNGDNPITFFEITTAMAFAAFSRIEADVVLLEVGMGGRLDCTNIIPSAAVSVITPVSIDHAEFLGETLEDIAFEKAGILKKNVPCVVGPQKNAVLNVIREHAQEMDTPLSIYDEGYAWDDRYPLPNLIGAHQLQNAATAIAAVMIFNPSIGDDHIASGLKNTTWRGRLQDVGAYFSDATTWDIYYDGGHNQAAGEAIAAQIKDWRAGDGKACHLIIGMMAHKQPEAFLSAVAPHVASINVVPIAGEIEQANVSGDAPKYSSIREAVQSIQSREMTGRILIAGSLYLAQEIFGDSA